MINPFKKLITEKRKAEMGLQNYGANIRTRIDKGQADLKARKISSSAYINPFPNPFKASSYKRSK